MGKIFNIVQPQRKKSETDKTRWVNLGILLQADDGKMSIKLNSLPFPGEDGECWLRVFEKEPRADADVSSQPLSNGSVSGENPWGR